MSKQPKPVTITPAIAKRFQQAGYEQPRHGRCLICNGDWDTCPHNQEQIQIVGMVVKMSTMVRFSQ